MTREEKRLVIMLSQTDMNLDEVTATMILIKNNTEGIRILTDWLNSTNEHESQKILAKAMEIMNK